MSNDPSEVALRRASMLLEQRRFEAAQSELRRCLADDPDNASAHALLSLALSQDDRIGDRARTPEHREQLVAATDHGRLAIAADPNDAIGFYAVAVSMAARGDHAAAIEAGRSAIALDPYDPSLYAVVSASMLNSRQFKPALETAEAGLKVDPEHGPCTNLRSLALDRMGRGGDALDAAGAQLRRQPDDAQAHAAVGFAHLNRGEHRQAQESFREALRLDPTDEFARSGMIQAINSGNPFYRILHRYFVWISRLDQRVAFGLMIGIWLLANGLDDLAVRLPALAPYTQPILMVYLLFALSTWIASPLMNTLLRFHPFGRHLLNGRERWTSNLIGGLLALSLVVGIGGWILGHFVFGLIGLVYGMILSVLVAASMSMRTTQQRALFGAASVGVALLPWIGLGLSLTAEAPGVVMGRYVSLFFYGCLAIQILSQVIASRTPRF